MATEWNASDYQRQSTLQQTLADENLERVTLDGSERVLDVGCGDGKITAQIAKRVPGGSVVGVDPSHDMIAFASGHFDPKAWPHLRFQVGDARSLGFHAEFDLVVSFYALHWVPEQDAALRAIRDALKPGGRTLLQLVGQGERDSIEDVIEHVRQLPRWSDHFPGFEKPFAHFTPDEYRTLAERAGLRVAELSMEDKSWDFGTEEAFTAFCHATFVIWTRHIPPTEHAAFIAEVLRRYGAVTGQRAAGVSVFRFYQLAVVVTRAS